jgi:hypothetical protein
MSSTIVDIIQDGQGHTIRPSQVPLKAGQRIEFSNSPGVDLQLVFSPAAIQLLSVPAGNPSVSLGAGKSLSFRVGQPGTEAYLCQILPAAVDPAGLSWPETGGEPVLTILAASLDDFAGLVEVTAAGVSPEVDR